MIRSRNIITSLGLALALAATVPACVIQGSARVRTRGVVVVRSAPPEPQYEEVKVRAGYVWVRGRWDWQGRWVWVPGHWERERAGKAWADGRWEQRGGDWVWVEGEWRTAGAHGTVVVNDGGSGHHGHHGGGPTVVDHRGHGGGTTVVVNDGPKVVDHRGHGGGTTVVVVNDGRPRQAPPSPQAENPGNKAGYIWVTGHWDWQSNNWQWVPGHWERPKAKHRYRPVRWELQGDIYIKIDGGWEREDDSGPKVRDHR